MKISIALSPRDCERLLRAISDGDGDTRLRHELKKAGRGHTLRDSFTPAEAEELCRLTGDLA